MVQNIKFYCVNFEDSDRKGKMVERFSRMDIPLHFVKPVYLEDPRLFEKHKNWAIMLQHLDSLQDFLETSDANYCVVCEDDILISKDFKTQLPWFTEIMNKNNLDVLLLGFLMPFAIEPWNTYFTLKDTYEHYRVLDYPNDIWGSQMYMMTRSHAEYMLKNYSIEYVKENPKNPFNPDWILTKKGEKALLYPMPVVEDGTTKTKEEGEVNFHKRCFETNYKKDEHF